VFSNEPLLEVVAPMPEAQLIETFVMNQVHVQTVQASKAQRVVTAANGRPVVDFGARRMHGIDAALKAARAFWIGGVASTSNVLAGKLYGVPVAGTMAHSYIQAHENEMSSFRAFAGVFPETVLLVDTYDTLDGVRKVIDLAKTLGEDFKVKAVRLDSGDLLALSKEARRLLDEAGLKKVEIFASGGLNFRRGHQYGGVERCAGSGYCLQAFRVCRKGPAEIIDRQADPSRSQAGVSYREGWAGCA
jgi:nicotinate phosphoribosyltransferase